MRDTGPRRSHRGAETWVHSVAAASSLMPEHWREAQSRTGRQRKTYLNMALLY